MRFALITVISASVAFAGGAGAAGATGARKAPKKEPERPLPQAHGLLGLLHASPERVRLRLGEPSIARSEGRGAFWTYRGRGCALYIFFKDDGGPKVSGAAAGPARRGEAAPGFDACLAAIEGAPAPGSAP